MFWVAVYTNQNYLNMMFRDYAAAYFQAFSAIAYNAARLVFFYGLILYVLYFYRYKTAEYRRTYYEKENPNSPISLKCKLVYSVKSSFFVCDLISFSVSTVSFFAAVIISNGTNASQLSRYLVGAVIMIALFSVLDILSMILLFRAWRMARPKHQS